MGSIVERANMSRIITTSPKEVSEALDAVCQVTEDGEVADFEAVLESRPDLAALKADVVARLESDDRFSWRGGDEMDALADGIVAGAVLFRGGYTVPQSPTVPEPTA